jgi:mRNA interferase RelE/StbE
VKVWREYRGLTLRALAEKAQIAPAYLSEIETRKKPGSVKTMAALACALDLEIEALIDQAD